MMFRLRRKNPYQHVSNFDRGQIRTFRVSYHSIAAHVGRNSMTVWTVTTTILVITGLWFYPLFERNATFQQDNVQPHYLDLPWFRKCSAVALACTFFRFLTIRKCLISSWRSLLSIRCDIFSKLHKQLYVYMSLNLWKLNTQMYNRFYCSLFQSSSIKVVYSSK